MSPTAELRYVMRDETGWNVGVKPTLQQKWVAHHIPAGKTEAEFEWRDVQTMEETK